MAFEFPFNLAPKTTAKASEVMANFNAIKKVLTNGIKLENFAPGVAPTILAWNGGEFVTPPNNTDLLAGGEVEFELEEKSHVNIMLSSYLRVGSLESSEPPDANVVATLYLDGAAILSAELGVDAWDFLKPEINVQARVRGTVSDNGLVTLAAGTHKIRVAFTRAGHEIAATVFRTRVTALIVPTA